MLILVANLGSTSFKYKLFDLASNADTPPRVVGSGSADRIGQPESAWSATLGQHEEDGTLELPDHAAAAKLHLDLLERAGVIESINAIDAVGFKAVHGGPISGAVKVDDNVLDTMQRFADVAPAHNPPYIAAMRAFAKLLPDTPQVAAFETGYHQTIPKARQVYAIPHEWTEDLGIRRYGFHGASHRYIATRLAEIHPQAKRIVNLHLGGSCSITAIKDGQSVANSFGMTAQSGVFHNNRVGDFDTFALLKLFKADLDVDTIFQRLGKEGGLLGISGVSADIRDVHEAAEQGNDRAKLAVDAFVESCRHYLGAYLVALGGADAISFTGGIGQHDKIVRAAICQNLGFAGIKLDLDKNNTVTGKDEQRIEATDSQVAIWVLPTNEELIVARQTAEVLGRATH
ncbi:acetate/propionate family kinase [Phycisphaerales bacterium AB-hyl4]|uniref:Acetate kinase n=1 Tax=Natronomicrosphaera hydrolytica TaxID=3242702 RepID=A0ABV4UAC0_9BACT